MATENVTIQLESKADLKGFKQVETAAMKLNKQIKNLAKTFGYAYGAQALGKFAKDSIKAFVGDEEAANRLSLAVKNLGMEFANPYITGYIQNLEATSKVADDELRPAFQALLQQTASLSKAQSILNTAIEVSRGSGTDLATVSQDLAQAYVGNTKGLKKYYLGLTQAQLKAKSFTEIQKIMNDQFAGSSAAYLQTYSGQIGVLSLAWGNFQETVGGALLTMASFGQGSKSEGLSNLASLLDNIGKAVNLISKGWDSVAKLLNVTGEGGLLSKFNPYGSSAPSKKDDTKSSLDKYAETLARIEADRKKAAAQALNNQKKLTADQKKQAMLKKQSALFDLEQIQLIAALKGKLSDEDRKRVELQLAILQENSSEATKLTNEIAMSIDKTGNLAKYLQTLPDANNPFKNWSLYLDAIEAQAARIASMTASTGAPTSNVGTGMTGGTSGLDFGGNVIGSQVPNFTPQVVVTFQGADSLSNALRDSFVSASMDGSFSQINRTVGAFDR